MPTVGWGCWNISNSGTYRDICRAARPPGYEIWNISHISFLFINKSPGHSLSCQSQPRSLQSTGVPNRYQYLATTETGFVNAIQSRLVHSRSGCLNVRTFFDSNQSQESKSEVWAQEFCAAMDSKTLLDNAFYLSSLSSNLNMWGYFLVVSARLTKHK